MKGSVLGGRYLADEEIGSGGMGAVYSGTDLRTGGKVAIKVPHPWLDKDSTFLLRLRREAEIAASLTNPRIVRVIDFDTHEGRPFLVMEFVPGPTLADVLTGRGTIEWREAARIGIEVARALDAAHQRGIVHRDLKPQNIKVVDGDVKVLDFGIARAEGSQQLTSASVFVGTPDYVAPERMGAPVDPNAIPGDPTVPPGDIRSDIYSLGIIMYEMLTGKPPFGGTTSPWALLRAHESEPPPPLADTVPFAMQAVVARCLAKRPDARYQTPRDLVTALQEALSDPESRPSTGQLPVAAVTPPTGQVARPQTPGSGTPTGTPPSGTGAQVRPSTPEWGTAVPERSGRPTAIYALGGAAAVIVLVAVLLFALRGGGGGGDGGQSLGTTAAQVTAAATTAAPGTPAGLRVERLAVFPANGGATNGDGVDSLNSGTVPRVCYEIPNASQALVRVIIQREEGAEVGRAEGAVPPSGRDCKDIRTEGQLQSGTYIVRLLDATNQPLRQRRFTVP